VDHLIRNEPHIRDVHKEVPVGETSSTEATASGKRHTDSAPNIFLFDSGSQLTPSDKSQTNSDSIMMEQMHLQKEQIAQQQKMLQQMAQQQATIQQLLISLSIGQGAQRSQSTNNENFGASLNQEMGPTLINRVPDISSAATGQAVKFLSSQIPTFGGTDDEDVEYWIEKLENVAEIHNLSTIVMLAGATSKLTKIARRWLDLSTGDVNRSWFTFKAAVIDHFSREVLFHVDMQKIEARRWNSASESFRDYAMDKLALMQRLKLKDPDKIKLLISGICNLSVKCAAATIRVNTVYNQLISL